MTYAAADRTAERPPPGSSRLARVILVLVIAVIVYDVSFYAVTTRRLAPNERERADDRARNPGVTGVLEANPDRLEHGRDRYDRRTIRDFPSEAAFAFYAPARIIELFIDHHISWTIAGKPVVLTAD